MTAAVLSKPTFITGSARVWPLARIEAKRYARHPLFLFGLVIALVLSAGERGPIELDYQVIPAFFIGVLGVVVAARLTTSTQRARPLVEAAPLAPVARTAAACLACLVPGAGGLLVVVMHHLFVLADPIPAFQYGTYGPADRVTITMVLPVIACVGGPLLGVVAGRLLRFPGAVLLVVAAVLLWSAVASYVPAQSGIDSSSTFARALHMFTPYTAFGSGRGDGNGPLMVVRSYTGSAMWFAAWTLLLAALTANVALLSSATGSARRLLNGCAAMIGALACAALVLSMVTGNARMYDTSPGGRLAVAAQGVQVE